VSEEVWPPSGTLTFVFSDVVGWTRAREDHLEAVDAVLECHDEIVGDHIDGELVG